MSSDDITFRLMFSLWIAGIAVTVFAVIKTMIWPSPKR